MGEAGGKLRLETLLGGVMSSVVALWVYTSVLPVACRSASCDAATVIGCCGVVATGVGAFGGSSQRSACLSGVSVRERLAEHGLS